MLRSARCVRFTAATPFAVTRKKRFDLPPQVRVDVTFRFQATKSGIDRAYEHLPINT